MNVQWADYASALVLLAALMHALWNAILKIQGERAVVVFLITGGAALGGAVASLFLPLPAAASWPYIAASTTVHCAYLLGLSAAYQRTELSVAYPIARGAAPAVVLLVSLLFLSAELHFSQVLGIALLVAGILSLAFGPLRRTRAWAGPAFAALTAVCIAAYSLIDGAGARLAGNAHSYAAWLFISQFIPVCVFVLWRYRSTAVTTISSQWRMGLLGGLLSLFSYWLVIWAMTVISVPVAVALRETSVLFAMLMGVIWLKEPWSAARWLAVVLVLCGVLLIKL